MANSSDQIVTWCELEWDAWKADCSGFVKAVCSQDGISLRGNANQIVDYLTGSLEWEKLGAEPGKATERANDGKLVIGGLKHEPHGHVVIVVKSQPLNYPVGYWGRFGAVGRKKTTINWSWNRADLPKVHYFAALK
ncbi:MAG: hypothetical protein JWP34_3428 [Massilia sp.]|nr:hypothetical protein [Massilia sp.]